MRRSYILLAAAALAVAIPSQAKPAFVKGANDARVKNCASCHVGAPKKGGEMTAMGKWLEEQKAAKKAKDVDPTWVKDYKGK